MDKTSNDSNPPSRRDFLMELTALTMLGKEHLNTGPHVTIPTGQPPTSRASGGQKFVAIQIGARSFVDEGVESALDTPQQKGGVNEEVYGLLYHTVKQIKPKAQVGWHIMNLVTMSPFYQAEQDYSRLATSADFLKPCPYNNCAGPRFAHYIRNVQSTVFRDLSPEEVLALHCRLLGYEHEAPLDKLPTAGMSAEYVARETRRALAEVNGAVPIYPGIDIDIPTALDEKRTQPADVKAAVLAAFKAGAPGVVLSRKYAEMKLTNLAGAGEALSEPALSHRS